MNYLSISNYKNYKPSLSAVKAVAKDMALPIAMTFFATTCLINSITNPSTDSSWLQAGASGILYAKGMQELSSCSTLSNIFHKGIAGDEKTSNEKSDLILQEIIDQAAPENGDEREILFLVLPTTDHNLAFSLENKCNRANIEVLAQKYKIKWVRAESVADITIAMETVNQTISHLMICGHGNTDGTQIGNSATGALLSNSIQLSDFPNIAKDAHILFDSCLTGVPDGIAENLSRLLPEATIFAPASVSSPNKTWAFVDKDGKPALLQLSQSHSVPLTQVYKGYEAEPFFFQNHLDELHDIAMNRNGYFHFIPYETLAIDDPRLYEYSLDLSAKLKNDFMEVTGNLTMLSNTAQVWQEAAKGPRFAAIQYVEHFLSSAQRVPSEKQLNFIWETLREDIAFRATLYSFIQSCALQGEEWATQKIKELNDI